jgi:hypothetical protein
MSQRMNARTWSPGWRVRSFSRVALPQIGEATVTYDTGIINGKTINPPPLDLYGAELRIQHANPPGVGKEGSHFTPKWSTVWWGTIEQIDEDIHGGEITLHCFDGLYRAKRWLLTDHGALVGNRQYLGSPGHPGYNLSVDGWYARVMGNKSYSGLVWDRWKDYAARETNPNVLFTFPGADGANTTAWTDQEAAESALALGRGPQDPKFVFDGAKDLLKGTGAWSVAPGESAWSVVARICDRRRGRGLVYVDWENDTDNPTEKLKPVLRIKPQTPDDVTYTPPGSTLKTLPGATTAVTAATLDLSGDQRLLNGSLRLGDRCATRYDYVESRGEPIQVLVTLSYADGSLQKRWTDADATAFNALTVARHRASVRWDPVYQAHGIYGGWDCTVGDGTNYDKARCDWRCNDKGILEIDNNSSPTSVLGMRILADLPLYEGYDYTAGAPLGGERYDGATDQYQPPRRPPLLLQRNTSSSDRWLDLSRMGFSLSIDGTWGLVVRFGADQDDQVATRYLSEPPTPGYGASYTLLTCTIGLELPNRPRIATGDARGRRRLVITHPGIHLWLAQPSAIWDLDRVSSLVADAPAKRTAGADSETTGIQRLRDDREWLTRLHALACAWYLNDHRTLTWTLRSAPGLFEGDAPAAPALGTLITAATSTTRTDQIRTDTINTPVTAIVYDHEAATTTYTTDWADLDFAPALA